MELSGARSNPQPRIELARLGELHHRLLREAAANPQQPRTARPKPSPVLEIISLVLELAGQPMRARQIHATAERLTTQRFLWTSVRAALAAGTSGSRPRFERVRHGVYQSARREHH